MASTNKENKGKGAAGEPEPEPDDASSTLAASSYDPTIYQRPHPDDRGGGGGGKKGGATTKARGKGAAAPTDKDKDKEGKSGKAKEDGGHRCANCDKPGAAKKCRRCGVEWYCDRNCQRVSWRWW